MTRKRSLPNKTVEPALDWTASLDRSGVKDMFCPLHSDLRGENFESSDSDSVAGTDVAAVLANH